MTRRPCGIIPVHLYGHPADMDAINHIAAVHGLWVVEDAAKGGLARYKGRPTGTRWRRFGTFSFYGNKIFTCGEGGALRSTTRISNSACAPSATRGWTPIADITSPSPATTFGSPTSLPPCFAPSSNAGIRSSPAAERSLPNTRKPFPIFPASRFNHRPPGPSWPPGLCITVGEEFGHDRDRLAAQLGSEGIDSRPFFLPLHRLPPFRQESSRRGEILPHTDRLAARGLNLPTFNALTESDIGRISRRSGSLGDSQPTLRFRATMRAWRQTAKTLSRSRASGRS